MPQMKSPQQRVEQSPDTNVFKLALAPEQKNRALYISNPDNTLRRVVHRVMENQYSGHPDVIARQQSGAFFQTGHEPDAEELLIEFWNPDEAAHRTFMAYLQEEYRKARESEATT